VFSILRPLTSQNSAEEGVGGHFARSRVGWRRCRRRSDAELTLLQRRHPRRLRVQHAGRRGATSGTAGRGRHWYEPGVGNEPSPYRSPHALSIGESVRLQDHQRMARADCRRAWSPRFGGI